MNEPDTEVPEGWPPGYRCVYTTDRHRSGFGMQWQHEKYGTSLMLAYERTSSRRGAREKCRCDAWKHYATTREHPLERRMAELEQELKERRLSSRIHEDFYAQRKELWNEVNDIAEKVVAIAKQPSEAEKRVSELEQAWRDLREEAIFRKKRVPEYLEDTSVIDAHNDFIEAIEATMRKLGVRS